MDLDMTQITVHSEVPDVLDRESLQVESCL